MKQLRIRGGVGKKILGEQIANHYQASENPLPQKTGFFGFNCLPVYTIGANLEQIYLITTNQFYGRCRQENQGPHNDPIYQPG